MKLPIIFPALCSILFSFASNVSALQTNSSTRAAGINIEGDNASDALNLMAEVSITTKDKFTLSADYYEGSPRSDGFLLLHGCQSDRQSLTPIAKLLAEQGHHVLSMDLRGYGKSTSEQYSHANIKRNTKDIINYQQRMAQLMAYWEEDVLAGYEHLATKLAKENNISILSVGCAARYAVSTAEQLYVANMALLSPDMDYATKERYKNLRDIASFFISSVHHVQSYQTAKELFEWNGHDRSTMLLYKGNYAGNHLLRRNKSLAIDIAHWLSERAK
ncbi:alpha/beta hydrolase [Thalassotalea euphylliae]|uniref:Alpha/beta hydrolase n=1 Tax=Thalassotalea euphylliae TaxID=1655234 RepID=A0A3E0U2F3_9GAMM|nr:alpha/beta hydrolase [Thalassotalea euphylliae]REL31161.1 alpha/beta hydrolase [Thalassotalea euphylliae]